MFIISKLWRDDAGMVLSAEAVLLGSVGVLGAVAGLSTISHSVDAELKEVGIAIRSLDQSYGYCGHQSSVAWTAGSYFVQTDVKTAVSDLGVQSEADVRSIQERVDAIRKRSLEHLPDLPGGNEPAPAPNDLPRPESAPRDKTL